MNLAVGTSRCLELLARLKHRLGILGVRAEVREHLMSLVVFPSGPALPVCVFVSGDGRFYSWDSEQRKRSVFDVGKAAEELAVIAVRHSGQQPPEVEGGAT